MVADICDSDNRGETVRAALRRAVRRLNDAGVSGPQRDARKLLAWAARWSAVELSVADAENRPLAPEVADRFVAAVARRAERAPLSHIVGGREFYGRWFEVGPDALDPRPESETLVAAALRRLPSDRPAQILDLGVGSGCLLLSLLAERPCARGLGVDSSDAALALAARNAAALGLTDRVALRRGDWLAGVTGHYDAILCNPPYISEADWRGLAPEVRLHEPKAALTPGPDGLTVYRTLAPRLPARLAPDGAAFFEVGLGQADAVADLLRDAGLAPAIERDLDARPRVVIAEALAPE